MAANSPALATGVTPVDIRKGCVSQFDDGECCVFEIHYRTSGLWFYTDGEGIPLGTVLNGPGGILGNAGCLNPRPYNDGIANTPEIQTVKWQIFLKKQIWQMKGWVSTIKKNA